MPFAEVLQNYDVSVLQGGTEHVQYGFSQDAKESKIFRISCSKKKQSRSLFHLWIHVYENAGVCPIDPWGTLLLLDSVLAEKL